MRRWFAILSVLALTLCVGRVGAWASPAASAHDCCHAPKGSAPAAAMDACCPVAAAVVSPRVACVSVLAATAVPAPRIQPPSLFVSAVAFAPSSYGAPPGRSTGPARAPPPA